MGNSKWDDEGENEAVELRRRPDGGYVEEVKSYDTNQTVNMGKDRYPRKYKLACLDIFTVIDTEQKDVRFELPTPVYNEAKKKLEAKGKPWRHLVEIKTPTNSKGGEKWTKHIGGDLWTLFLLIFDFYQLVSYSLLLPLPWVEGFILPGFALSGDVSGPAVPKVNLPNVSLDASLPGYVPPSWLMVDFRNVFKFGALNINLGPYLAWYITSAMMPFLLVILMQVYFSQGRFFGRKARGIINMAVGLMVSAVYLPAFRTLLSPFSCTRGDGGHYYITRSLELEDPVRCAGHHYPFLGLISGLCALGYTILAATITNLDQRLYRPRTRFSPSMFSKGRVAMIPKALTLIAKTGYVLAATFGPNWNVEFVAWFQASLACLIAFGWAFYPVYFSITGNFLSSAFMTLNALVAIVTGLHASGLEGMDDIDAAVFALCVGAPAAFVGGGLLAVSGHYAWGMQTYRHKPPGSVPPLLPFGLGKNIDACGQGEIPKDEREECHCGGPTGGDSEPSEGCCAGGGGGGGGLACCAGSEPKESEEKPRPMNCVVGRPCYIICCCCAKTDPKEPRFWSKWRAQNILMWTMCLPLSLLRALRHCNKVTRPKDTAKPDPKHRPTSFIREGLWWLVCFPCAFINKRVFEGADEERCGVEFWRWMCCFPCSLFRENGRVRARYARAGTPDDLVEDNGPILHRHRIANCVFWLACCPYAYIRSAGRRYNETVRAWYAEKGRPEDAPEMYPRKNAPIAIRECLYMFLCFPFAFVYKRLRYNREAQPALLWDLILWCIAPCWMFKVWLKRMREDDEAGQYEEWEGEIQALERPPVLVRMLAKVRGTSETVARNYKERARSERRRLGKELVGNAAKYEEGGSDENV